MESQFWTRQQAIEKLHEWFFCYQCGAIVQPFRIKQTLETTTYTMGCGCVTKHLYLNKQVARIIQGGHIQESFLTFETRDSKGNLIEHMTQWGRSFLAQYYTLLSNPQGAAYNQNVSVGSLTALDTTNTSRTLNAQSQALGARGATQDGAGDNAYGMQVGTGSTANAAATDQLVTLIANGNAATQLAYGSMGITLPGGSAPLSYTFTRTFTNNSGSTITINEAGLAVAWEDSGSTQRNFLIIRDLTGGVAVLNGANTTGTYTLSYTIS